MPIELVWVAAVALTFGCVVDGAATLVRRGDPPAIQAACRVAEARCAACHSLERVAALAPSDPDDWRGYVRRMRLTPGSDISADDERVIVACLRYRSGAADAAAMVTP